MWGGPSACAGLPGTLLPHLRVNGIVLDSAAFCARSTKSDRFVPHARIGKGEPMHFKLMRMLGPLMIASFLAQRAADGYYDGRDGECCSEVFGDSNARKVGNI
jgi:hypothetical protein